MQLPRRVYVAFATCAFFFRCTVLCAFRKRYAQQDLAEPFPQFADNTSDKIIGGTIAKSDPFRTLNEGEVYSTCSRLRRYA